MIGFYQSREMFPNKLYYEKQNQENAIFRRRPELLEFKRASNRHSNRDDNKKTGEPAVKPLNKAYKDKSGTTYGLYQRFYWDSSNVPFGGIPNFQR